MKAVGDNDYHLLPASYRIDIEKAIDPGNQVRIVGRLG